AGNYGSRCQTITEGQQMPRHKKRKFYNQWGLKKPERAAQDLTQSWSVGDCLVHQPVWYSVLFTAVCHVPRSHIKTMAQQMESKVCRQQQMATAGT
ncbi:unnamed protein product, partial [Eretmochelys imbricata]